MPVVIVQNWMELERGWGTRPDGFTVHASVEARNTHAQWYHATFNASAVVPDEYTTTSGDAFPVDADDAVAAAIAAAPNGVVNGNGTWWPVGKRLTIADVKVNAGRRSSVVTATATPSTHAFGIYYATKAKTTCLRSITTTAPVIKVGRAPGSAIKFDGLVWQHAVIGVDGATISVIDLGGGVAVDGCAVKVTTVKPGARLNFGTSKFYVVVDP